MIRVVIERGWSCMAEFKDILGHEGIIAHLQNAVSMDKISHSYIMSGEDGLGKSMLADAFAKTLQCEEGGITPCGKCRSCIQAESGHQPDIIHVTHEKPNSRGVDDVREQLVDDIVIKPYSSKYKIYIIDEAEKLTVQAQNAILKTIEEPPAYAVIIFLTNNAGVFLPTILSRCVMLSLKPVKNQLIVEYLMKNCKIPEYHAQLCAAFAQGRPGRAVKLAASPDFEEIKSDIIKLLKNIHNMELTDLAAAIKDINNYDISVDDCLDIMTLWFRDVLLFKVSRDPNSLVFTDEVADIRRAAGKSSYEGLELIMEAFDKAKTRLHANVNYDMTMELLLLTIKEN